MSNSQLHRAVDIQTDPEELTNTYGQRSPPQSVPYQTSQEPHHSSDSSTPLFTLYLRTAEDRDAKTLEVLEKDTDQILIFCGLFSATVAALTVPSADPSSDTYSPMVTSFWLFSLLLSISCALVALSLRRWAQPRTWVILPHHSPVEQARLHALFANGIERVNLTFLVGVLHGLVHISFSVFLIGLYTYFVGFVLSLFVISFVWIVLSLFVYGYFMAFPLSLPSPRFSSLPLVQFVTLSYIGLCQGAIRLFHLVASLFFVSEAQDVLHSSLSVPRHHLSQSIDLTKLAEDKAQVLAPQLDGDVLKRTLAMMRSDDDLEQFFEAVPGFCLSKIVNSKHSLNILGQQRLAEELVGFWNRTLSSNRVSESAKGWRLVVCIRVIKAADLSIAVPWILHIFSGDLSGVSGLANIGHSLAILCNDNAASIARGIIARIISINNERDERWSTLAMGELDIPEDVLRHYLSHGDSLLLANLIHITRHFFDDLRQRDLGLTRMSLGILPSVSKFNIRNTLPKLRREFCELWNKIVEQAQTSGADDSPFVDILVEIRGLYVVLHNTDGALTASATINDDHLHQLALYSSCMVPDHRMQEVGGSIVSGGENHTTTTTSSIPEPIARSSPGTGDALQPDKEIIELESPSSAKTASVSSATLKANENSNAQDSGLTIQTEPARLPGESGPSAIDANRLQPQDHDSTDSSEDSEHLQ